MGERECPDCCGCCLEADEKGRENETLRAQLAEANAKVAAMSRVLGLVRSGHDGYDGRHAVDADTLLADTSAAAREHEQRVVTETVERLYAGLRKAGMIEGTVMHAVFNAAATAVLDASALSPPEVTK